MIKRSSIRQQFILSFRILRMNFKVVTTNIFEFSIIFYKYSGYFYLVTTFDTTFVYYLVKSS